MSYFGGAVKDVSDYEFAVLGIPFDAKSSFLRGAAQGPESVRKASSGDCINSWTELGVNLAEETTVVDLGDVEVSGSIDDVFRRIETSVAGILEKKAFPVIIGGDHSVTLPVVKAVSRTHQPLDILHFDAHPDLYLEFGGDRLSHACPFARILEQGLAARLVQVGIRAATGDNRAVAEKYGVRMIEMKDLEVSRPLSFRNPLYISVDIDVLDPAFAPGVSHHEPGGLSPRQLIRMIHDLDARIIGMDLVEINGARDSSGITAAAGAKIIMEIMGKAVFRRR